MDYALMAQEFCKAFTGKGCRKVTKLLDEGFKGMYVILRILRNSETEVLPSDIAKRMDVSTARVAAALNSLSKKGFIERIPDNLDGRKIVLKITPSGLQALEEREIVVYNLIEMFLKKITEEEATTFLAIVKKLFQ